MSCNITNARIEIMDSPEYTDVLRKIERSGRVCYKSEEKITENSAEQFVRGIIKRGHESVLEHVTLSVLVVCDRGVSHEIVRHRIASYSQESTRYCNYTAGKFGGHITVIDPANGFCWDLDNEADAKKWKIWRSAMYAADMHYNEMIEAGATAQEARTVLPNSLKTEIVMTMNLREWRHFFRLRCDKAAHPQMREVAGLISRKFAKEYPVFFEDLEMGEGHVLSDVKE